MQEITNIKKEILEEFLRAGVQYGRGQRYTHPSMRPFLGKPAKTVELFDLNTTYLHLQRVASYLKNLIKENKTILFVGVTPAASKPIENIAKLLNQPYMNFKWVGGFLTNFETIKSRLIYFRNLLEKEQTGLINQYPPKERKQLLNELDKMKKVYGGVKNLENKPDALFIVNLAFKSHKTARREAQRCGIPIIALAGSDNDIKGIEYFIPANDKAPRAIETMLNHLAKLITA